MRDLSAQVYAIVPPAAAHPNPYWGQALQVQTPRMHQGLLPALQFAVSLQVHPNIINIIVLGFHTFDIFFQMPPDRQAIQM